MTVDVSHLQVSAPVLSTDPLYVSHLQTAAVVQTKGLFLSHMQMAVVVLQSQSTRRRRQACVVN